VTEGVGVPVAVAVYVITLLHAFDGAESMMFEGHVVKEGGTSWVTVSVFEVTTQVLGKVSWHE
jgi:hypothetical protein